MSSNADGPALVRTRYEVAMKELESVLTGGVIKKWPGVGKATDARPKRREKFVFGHEKWSFVGRPLRVVREGG